MKGISVKKGEAKNDRDLEGEGEGELFGEVRLRMMVAGRWTEKDACSTVDIVP